MALEGVAACIASRDPARAAELLGAAAELWSAAPDTIATHRADLERTTTVIRSALDAPTFTAATNAGAVLDRPTLIALARGE